MQSGVLTLNIFRFRTIFKINVTCVLSKRDIVKYFRDSEIRRLKAGRIVTLVLADYKR